MKFNMHRYKNENDYDRIREFLREVFIKNNRHELSWQVYRFDYWRWHGVANIGHGKLETDVFIWEAPGGQTAAVLNREAPGSVFLQVHPDCQTPELIEEMITVAEKYLAVPSQDNRRKLHIWSLEQNSLRQEILQRREYVKTKKVDYQRYRSMSEPIADIPIPEGYKIRALGGEDELPARSYLSWRAFHPNEPDENYEGWQWYHNIQKAPLYRRELDIVAEAPNGDLASFCTVWFDEVTLAAAFEPVGTSPEHQRRGLAAAVMTEGLRRLKNLGAVRAFVGSWNEATHKLYGSLGFREYDKLEAWGKEL
jgi:predicted N-acetyltransferase YhbS